MTARFQTRQFFKARKQIRDTEKVVIDAAAQVGALRALAGRQRFKIVVLSLAAISGWALTAGLFLRALLNHGH